MLFHNKSCIFPSFSPVSPNSVNSPKGKLEDTHSQQPQGNKWTALVFLFPCVLQIGHRANVPADLFHKHPLTPSSTKCWLFHLPSWSATTVIIFSSQMEKLRHRDNLFIVSCLGNSRGRSWSQGCKAQLLLTISSLPSLGLPTPRITQLYLLLPSPAGSWGTSINSGVCGRQITNMTPVTHILDYSLPLVSAGLVSMMEYQDLAYVTFHDTRDFADVIKVPNQLTLS